MKKKKQTFVRNRFDYSQHEDLNPTKLLQEASHTLKEITCLETLKAEMTKVVEKSSISRKNLLKFKESRDKIETLTEMQLYLYNYILAGSAMQTKFGDL